MSAEIICVGTELLLGDILNSNAQFLAQELANLGIPHYFQTVVGDNVPRLHQAIEIACQRASLLIFTGGLGPTPDDLTTEAIASFFGAPLGEREEIIKDIEDKFARRGLKMGENNRKQALFPRGAMILPNPTGTAPGTIWQPLLSGNAPPSRLGADKWRENLTILTFPGVPSEMKRMWRETAVPFLQAQGWGREIIHSRMLRFRGIGESALAEKVNHLFALTNPTVAPYASKGEVRLRICARARTRAEAESLIEPVAEEIKAIAGLDYFGSDGDTLASVVGELLRQRRETVAVAESCTAGGLGAMLTEISGASAYFLGGIIAYGNEVKIKQLGVSPQDLANHGAISRVVAEQMASGVREKFASSWGISITGIAGPGGASETKPIGLVYIGIAEPSGNIGAIRLSLGENRERNLIRYLSSCHALDRLRRKLVLNDKF